jgi:hypothetical protein
LNPRPRHPERSAAPRFARACASLLSISALSAWSAPAPAASKAEEKRVCAVASEEAQLRRIHGKLRGARDQLLICARDVCPTLVKHDCDHWLAEVDASMPTVVISALDA